MNEDNSQFNFKRSDSYIERMSNERLQVMRSRFELDQSFDKYLLTFSTGTFYLTLYFLKDFIKNDDCLYFLILGWLLLIVSMFTSLGSLYYSRKSYMYLEDFLNDEIKKEFDQQELEKNLCDYNIYNNKYDDRIEYLEKMGIISFIFGIIIIFIYTINVIT